MTKAESLVKAWRLAAKEKDFSLVDELYHAEYKSIGGVSGVELNLPALREAFLAIAEHMIMGPYETIDENENFLRTYRHTKYREADIFSSAMSSYTYNDGKVINQETVFEEIADDPSEGKDWNWEDYE
jgi:hypothetical protein